MLARIFRPSKTAMQSGRAQTSHWVMEFEAEHARRIDPLMGWTSADETAPSQVRLTFDSQEEAVAYAQRHNIPFQVIATHHANPAPKSYADNFSFRRREPWTH